jgi:adenylate cyclase
VATESLPPAHVGMDAGPVVFQEGDYFGRTVNIAARIAAQAPGDRVFVGETLVAGVEPRGFELREVGRFDLKGIAEPVTLYEAVRDGAGEPTEPR